jgi:hypothetical protein
MYDPLTDIRILKLKPFSAVQHQEAPGEGQEESTKWE